MDQQVHDLTLLFMKKSLNISDFKNPIDYARKYREVYEQIKEELSDLEVIPPIVSNY